MGYRSEVKSLIYGTEQEIADFKAATFDLYNQVRAENGDEITDERNDKFKLIFLNAPYSKWYDEYEEVQHWHDLLDLAKEAGLCTEFVRIGESSEGDIETDYSGEKCEYYLEAVQRVEANIYRDWKGE
jgi:hypothetical protein